MRATALGLAVVCLQIESGPSAIAADEKGLAVEDSVVLEGVSGELDGVAAEHVHTDKHYPAWTWRTQALMRNGGRVYDVIEMSGPGGETKSIYFDITDWFGKMQ